MSAGGIKGDCLPLPLTRKIGVALALSNLLVVLVLRISDEEEPDAIGSASTVIFNSLHTGATNTIALNLIVHSKCEKSKG